MAYKFNPITGNLDIVGSGGGSPPVGTPYSIAGYDQDGLLNNGINGWSVNTTSGGLFENLTITPDNEIGGFEVNETSVSFQPLQDSPDVTWNINNTYANLSSASFPMGENGNAVNLFNNGLFNQGTENSGRLAFLSNYFNIGNGSDPITVRGLAYSYGFGDIQSGVTITEQVQGYGFQINAHAGSILSQNVNAFYDFAQINTDVEGYNSYIANPILENITNNHNYNAFSGNPTINTQTGNAGTVIFGAYGNITQIDSNGSYNGLQVSPTIAENKNSVIGISVNLNNVTNYVGVKSSLVVQDITYEVRQSGSDGNNVTIEYTDTTTAGNEIATVTGGYNVTVSIQSGVSTAAHIIDALDSHININSVLSYLITGSPTNPQITYLETNLSGGINSGRKVAADFSGDVNINGSLSFSGGLSIGSLNSYASLDLQTVFPGVNSVDTLITAPFIADNQSVSGVDLLGVNTAMLLTMGTNSTLTSSFLGISALGLPAVLTLGSGATIDQVNGAVFALSLDSNGVGGTIDEVNTCRSLVIPNGVTTVNKLKGYKFDLPFGDPGTTTWGIYMEPNCYNYIQGNLLIGGTPDTNDTVINTSVALEINSTTKTLLNARMNSTERDGLTPIEGMVLFNTSTSKLQVYASSSWVDLH